MLLSWWGRRNACFSGLPKAPSCCDEVNSRLAVGVVVRSTERARNVGNLLEAEFLGPWAVWCDVDGPAAALGDLFDLRRTPLTGSPNGKGTVPPVTPHASLKTGIGRCRTLGASGQEWLAQRVRTYFEICRTASGRRRTLLASSGYRPEPYAA